MSDEDRTVAGVEYELMLLSRYHALSWQRGQQTLDRSAYLILARLELDRLMSLKELAEAFLLDVSTVNRQVGALERHELVERIADPDGGVARKIRATETGLARMRADRDLNRDGAERVLEDWAPDEIALLHDLLVRFNRDVEALEGRAWPRPESD
ncbi:transcriptional regulator [Prescottella equi]|uniref:MarR family winged helix-turn-helix transcriptional regulator n=1 Tax=Rhodococcus hoagii TaxID=43767 RepID=UPI000A0F7C4A|nr:MarR family transcriptional regulator [Prescottella equi]MBM4732856.1 MarR family transcriptional regulator [Prescottella equi]ORL32245.1 transcriptional regulator [Prescottella equi]ORL85796.1 transcriptional regulator [Prescottella equi]ORM23274.1 transcriptional regulator [Prescottella equi]